MTPDTQAEFAEFVRGLRTAGWTPLPISPPFATFLAVRFRRDQSQDALVVYDLGHVETYSERADGTTSWDITGTLASVREDLAHRGEWGCS